MFQRGAKVDWRRAVAGGTAVYPGEVEEIQYELDTRRQPRWEIDLVEVDSVRFRVEVVQIEAWQIGQNSAP